MDRLAPQLSTALLAAFVALIIVPTSGYAAHPYITDDTGTQGTGNWQLEMLGEHTRHNRIADPGGGAVNQLRRSTLINPVLTYGVRDNLDVALGLSRLRQRVKEDGALVGSASGTSDSTLDVKWRLYESGALSLGLKPGLVLPTGDENRGLGTGKLSWDVNSMLTYDAKPWVWLANIAYSEARFKRPEDASANRRQLWRFSAGIAHSLHDKFRLVGEAGVRTNQAKDDPFLPGRYGSFAMVGAIYSPTDKLDFDLSVRRAANRAELDTALLLGATMRW